MNILFEQPTGIPHRAIRPPEKSFREVEVRRANGTECIIRNVIHVASSDVAFLIKTYRDEVFTFPLNCEISIKQV